MRVTYLSLFGALLILVAYSYNRLVRSRERVREAWSGVDVQLKRRANLVPNLVSVVKGYARHEREVLKEVAEARGSLAHARNASSAAGANYTLSVALGHLLAVSESYPDLRASETFLQLQGELSDTEEKIAYARHFYNRNVLAYNTLIGRFPTLVFARLFAFKPAEFFEDDSTAIDVRVRFGNDD